MTTHCAPRVGIVGLGRMGLAIAERLRALDAPVVGFNRSSASAQRLAAVGGVPAASPRDVADASQLVLVAVPGPEACEQVILGNDGIAETVNDDLIVVDLSTISSAQSRQIASQLFERGIDMLDAPMTGSVDSARNGQLGLLVGGDKVVLDRAAPTLKLFARHIYHLGNNGAGCTAKLAMNLLVGAMAQALSEALALIKSSDLSQQLFLEAIATSGLSSPLYQRVGCRALDEDFLARFSLRNLHKDLALLVEEAQQSGIDLRLARLLEQLVHEPVATIGELDYSSLIAAEDQRVFTPRT